MKNYEFEVSSRFCCDKLRWTIIDMLENLGEETLQPNVFKVVLEKVNFYGKEVDLNLELEPVALKEKANTVAELIMSELSRVLGMNPQCFSGTLLIKGSYVIG